MRLTTVILIATFLQVSANGFAQKITLSKRNAPLKTIFKELRNQSGYVFLCTENQLKISNPVSINVNGEDFQNVLKQIFENQPLTYNINEKTITIREKERSVIDKVIDYFSSIDVSGKVVDENGQPIAGATIKVKGATMLTNSASDGSFKLKNVAEDAVLQISYIGFQAREVKAAVSLGSILLIVEVAKLEEVMVNAGYYSVKDSERTGSISRISAKDIEKQPVTNILATMQGRMPGVFITQGSGAPAGNFQIRIRGQNSIRDEGNDPLYIIDGIPFSSQTIGANQTAGYSPGTTSPLNSIDPSDISSIEVLKDADATAIYGSRGANGVVLITTKRGVAGKVAVTLGASNDFGQVTMLVDQMKTEQYLSMRSQAYANDKIQQYPADAYDINGTWDKNRYTNWQKELIGGTAKVLALNASVSGGSEKTQFLLSSNYRTETTVMPGDFRYNKGSVNFNMKHGADSDKLNIVFSAGYTLQANNQPSLDLTSISRNLAPNAPALYDDQGKLNWQNGTWSNPLARLLQEFTGEVNTLVAGSVVSYHLSPALVLKANMGYTDIRNTESKITPFTMYNPSYGLTSAASSIYLNNTARQSWTLEPQVTWSHKIAQGNLELLGGATFQNQRSDRLVQFGSGFPSNGLIYNLASASTRAVNASDQTIYKYQALFARINYTLQDRYMLNITARRDGSSRFGPNNRFAVFGAFGAAWIFSKETFLKDSKILSFGKLRGSYGTTGNDQIGDYQYFNTYAPTGVSYEGSIGLQPTRLYNPNFGWESNNKLEFALDAGFFNDKLFATAAWYSNRSSNQLVGIPLPGTTGFSSLMANLGATVGNTGFEFTIRTVNINKRNFNWTTSFNITTNRNKLIAFPGLESSTYAESYIVGKPIDIRHLYGYMGVSATTGIYQFIDYNSDAELSPLEDRKSIADLTPRFFGGLVNQLKYKGFSLDFLLQFVKQKNISYPAAMPGTAFNQLVSLTNVWQGVGDISKAQLFSTGVEDEVATAFYRFGESDGALVDASFIRLKNIALSYDFPVMLKGAAKLRLFGQAQNLLTITSFDNGDPELRYGSFLPPLRICSFGIQVRF
jgi:TonB-linked SusC/RagA family outer membrane protein